jgi:hypothetical protein
MRITDYKHNNRVDADGDTKNHYPYFLNADVANKRSRIITFCNDPNN